ncbi:hypothetical protein PN441_11650 [Spirulina major CS-329]|uniref:hypothetical protein n=1 Tax=Spirulina TaxID=1154 RepID=UPI00232F273B|nr:MULTISPECIES: hypothetical protein [Spirulina]MDB9493967.1 hypothetical protein [Spirulina subsalsa CS-330]MDB9503726.1 hypothetical protein [Spirulina major CS-329]
MTESAEALGYGPDVNGNPTGLCGNIRIGIRIQLNPKGVSIYAYGSAVKRAIAGSALKILRFASHSTMLVLAIESRDRAIAILMFND